MNEQAPTPKKLVVLTDEAGRIRAAALMPTPRTGAGAPPDIKMVPREHDVLHEIDLSEETARSIVNTDLKDYFVEGAGAGARLVKRDSGEAGA
jgi:hypothetical protein